MMVWSLFAYELETTYGLLYGGSADQGTKVYCVVQYFSKANNA